MKLANLVLAAASLGFLVAAGQANTKTYRWVDDKGVVHFGDSVPPEYADNDKQILNDQGVHVGVIRGKKTDEELAEEARQARLDEEREKKRRADQALLATYLSVEEIELHRDRRIELLQAQNQVTDLYLRNLARRLEWLVADAGKFQPYSADPEAPMIPAELNQDIDDTRGRIERYKKLREQNDEQAERIRQRFELDINRFRSLKPGEEAA